MQRHEGSQSIPNIGLGLPYLDWEALSSGSQSIPNIDVCLS